MLPVALTLVMSNRRREIGAKFGFPSRLKLKDQKQE